MRSPKPHKRHNSLQDHSKAVSMEDSKAVNKVVPNNIGQRDLQVAPPKKEVNDVLDIERKNTLENELQGYRYNQSSKFSSVSRTLIFGIIGTIWSIILKSEQGSICHPLLTTSLLLAIGYMICDVQHYYKDTQNYFDRQFQLDKAATNADLDKHDKKMDDLSKNSQSFVKMKYWLLWMSVISFMLGIIDNFYLSDAIRISTSKIIDYCISSL